MTSPATVAATPAQNWRDIDRDIQRILRESADLPTVAVTSYLDATAARPALAVQFPGRASYDPAVADKAARALSGTYAATVRAIARPTPAQPDHAFHEVIVTGPA